MGKAKEVVEETLGNLNIEGISLTLDQLVFDALYDQETKGSLDAQMNERLMQLNSVGAEGVRNIGRKLDLPKVAASALAVVFSTCAFSSFFKGHIVTAAVQGLIAHDLSVAAYNCHLKAYLLHGLRRIGATPVSSIFGNIASAVTGAADPNLAFLAELDTVFISG